MPIPENVFELKPHQESAILKMHNGCILCGGVGVGKSHTAVGYYLEHEAPRNVYVITTAKKRDKMDWQFLFADVGMTRDPETTMGAVVTVDSWNNMGKYKEVKDAFFIFDEQRLVGSGSWVKAFYQIAEANRWIMLSATPGDNWLDYVPVFRANGFIKNITQFKTDHVLQRWTGKYHSVVGYRQVGKLVRWRNQLLVDMPYERHTTRHSHDIWVDYDEDLIKKMVKDRWHVLENRPLQDASELYRVMKKVVYSDASRLAAIRTLMTMHPKLIVFYNHDYELEILRTLAQSDSTLSSIPISSSSSKTQADGLSEEATSSNRLPQDSTSLIDDGSTKKCPECLTKNCLQSATASGQSEAPSNPESTTESSTTSKSLCQNKPCCQYCPSYECVPQERSGDTGPSNETGRASKSSSNSQRLSTSSSKMDPSTSASTPDWRDSEWKAECSSTDCTCRQSDSSAFVTSEKMSGGPESKTRLGSSGRSERDLLSTQQFERLSTTDSEDSECQKDQRFLPPHTKGSISSESVTDTSFVKKNIAASEAYPRKTTGSPLSSTSSPSQDLLLTGNESSQSPQFQVAEWNGHKHEELPTTTSWVYLVQYVAGAEAWECTETDAICFYSMSPSYKNWHQAHGRIDRLNTSFSDLHYYRLISKAAVELATAKSLGAKKSFNESAWEKNTGFWGI